MNNRLIVDPILDDHCKLSLTTSFIPKYYLGIAFFGYKPFTQVVRPYTKEVIRPQVPLRPPCYDFSLVADPRFDSANETPPRQKPTSMKRRAVCARSRDVFTAR